MAGEAEGSETPAPLAPRVIGHVGLWASVAGLLGCVVLALVGVGRPGGGPRLLGGLVFLPVAAFGVWLFAGFVRLADWRVAPEMPLGVKLLGHVGRVVGSLTAGACIALAVMAVVFPAHVPPHPTREVGGVWMAVEPGSPAFEAPRPGLAALFVLGIFPALGLRLLGTAVAEMRRWARLGTLFALGAGVAVLTAALVLNLTQWRLSAITLPLAVGDALAAVVFVCLLVYFALPDVVDAFEAHGL